MLIRKRSINYFKLVNRTLRIFSPANLSIILELTFFFSSICIILYRSDDFVIPPGKSLIGAPSISEPSAIYSSPHFYRRYSKCLYKSSNETEDFLQIKSLYKTIPVVPPLFEIALN